MLASLKFKVLQGCEMPLKEWRRKILRLYFFTSTRAQDVDEVGDALGRGLLDDMDPVRHRCRFGIDVVDGHTALHILDERCSGIDHQRGADDDKDVGVMGQLSRLFHVRNRLTKENDVRPDVVAIGVQRVHTGHQPLVGQLVTGQGVLTLLVPDRTNLH